MSLTSQRLSLTCCSSTPLPARWTPSAGDSCRSAPSLLCCTCLVSGCLNEISFQKCLTHSEAPRAAGAQLAQMLIQRYETGAYAWQCIHSFCWQSLMAKAHNCGNLHHYVMVCLACTIARYLARVYVNSFHSCRQGSSLVPDPFCLLKVLQFQPGS